MDALQRSNDNEQYTRLEIIRGNENCREVVCDLFKNKLGLNLVPCWVSLAVSVSASHTVGRGLASRPGHTEDHYENGTKSMGICT